MPRLEEVEAEEEAEAKAEGGKLMEKKAGEEEHEE